MRAAKANRKIALWLFAGFLSFYICATRGHFYLSDEMEVFQQTRSLWERGDLAVTPNINTTPGPDGRYYAQYGIGQTVLALPFYVVGKELHRLLLEAGATSWIRTLEGPPIGDPDKRWGGEVEIFFVNLFCAFVMAALLAVFYFFNLRLGTAPRWAVVATLILGLTTHVAGFGVEFLQHPAEALFLLLAFYFLFNDAENPSGRSRTLAGSMAGMMILVRASSVVLAPALTAYLFWHAFKRADSKGRDSRWTIAAWDCAPFVIPVVAAVLLTMEVNNLKWGVPSFSGNYQAFNSFTNSYFVSIYGYLFSPGQSVFIFSPILILAPVYFHPFMRTFRAEAILILSLTISYVLFYGLSLTWHGQWCFGPRYLMAMVPLLLLPLGRWLGTARPAAWFAVVPLILLGGFVEVLHVAVNVSYVLFRAGYDKLVPSDAYLFIPQICQLVTHFHALLAFDDRVDVWLVNVARIIGRWRMLEILSALSAFLLLSILRVTSYLARAESVSKQLARENQSPCLTK